MSDLDSIKPSRDVLISYRYLRLALVLLPVLLAVSVVREHVRAPHNCWQTSISAYYYTPVQSVFVAVLVAIGLCLVAVRGRATIKGFDIEDGLLNLSGVLAPIVAFMPTPNVGPCATALVDAAESQQNVKNNVFAFVVAFAIAFLVALVIFLRSEPTGKAKLLFLVGTVVIGIPFAVLAWRLREGNIWPVGNLHNLAAIGTFGFVGIVAVVNAVLGIVAGGSRRTFGVLYAIAAGLMIVSAVACVVAGSAGWDHWIIGIESSLIGCFALYWGIQTVERWGDLNQFDVNLANVTAEVAALQGELATTQGQLAAAESQLATQAPPTGPVGS